MKMVLWLVLALMVASCAQKTVVKPNDSKPGMATPNKNPKPRLTIPSKKDREIVIIPPQSQNPWSDADMTKAISELKVDISSNPLVNQASKATVFLKDIQNNTGESVVLEPIKRELVQIPKIEFVDAASNAAYVLDGKINSITMQVGKDSKVFYKLTLTLSQGLKVAWTGYRQVPKSMEVKR